MTKFNRILVGHSLFPDGEVAVRSAVTLARKANATLYLLHIVEPYPLYQKMRFPTVSAHALLEEVVQKMRTQLNDLRAQPELAGIQTLSDAYIGKPFVELLRTARTWNASLVVVGTSQRGEGRFLGSTGERVLRKSQAPVLITKQELTSSPKTLLVPVDFSDCSKKAAEEAIALGRGFGGRVVFLHVLDLVNYAYPTAYGAAPIIVPPLTPDDIEPDWQHFLHGLPLNGLTWEKHTREGRPAAVIVETAQECASDLIVIGTHGRTGVAHMLLGSVAEAVLRLTDCSVLTVRPDAFRFELP